MEITDEIYFELCILHGVQAIDELVECSPSGLYLVEIDDSSFEKYKPVFHQYGKNYIFTEDYCVWFVDDRGLYGRFDIASWAKSGDTTDSAKGFFRLLADKILIAKGDKMTFFNKEGEKITYEEAVGYW